MGTIIPEDAVAEQIRYYRARAPHYDEAYRAGRWRERLDDVVALFDAAPIGGHVLELGAGTGFWTERLVDREAVASVTAVDAAPEAIDVSRRRIGDRSIAGRVDYVIADVTRWQPGENRWDAVVACFFLNHILDVHLPALLATTAAALRPGGSVFFVDEAVEPERKVGDEAEERTVHDGRSFTIVKHPRSPEEWRRLFDAAGIDVTVTPVHQFCWGAGVKR